MYPRILIPLTRTLSRDSWCVARGYGEGYGIRDTVKDTGYGDNGSGYGDKGLRTPDSLVEELSQRIPASGIRTQGSVML